MFSIVHHADWSAHSEKRWVASATFASRRWWVQAPRRVEASDLFLKTLFEQARNDGVLVGFDFPIGLPAAYGNRTGFANFRAALPKFGTVPGWERFFDVADAASEICVERPFYPRRSLAGVTRDSLTNGLAVSSFDELYRVCERGIEGKRTACSIFWTLGGNQVGKGALTGWREIVRPALDRGARLWPFDGTLKHLESKPGLVLAETYPADAYRDVGAGFGPGESKRRQLDRKTKAPAILSWADTADVCLADVEAALRDGFGGSAHGEDAFDALLGLFKMIEVVKGSIPEASKALSLSQVAWEGWIFGR
jgi:hypothetical protein